MRNKVQEFRPCKECEDKTANNLCGACINNNALISQLEGDEQRLDFLQSLLHRKKCILRMSDRGRGFRLHESTREGGEYSVRLAIDMFMSKNKMLPLSKWDSFLKNPVLLKGFDLLSIVGKVTRVGPTHLEAKLIDQEEIIHLQPEDIEIGYLEEGKEIIEVSLTTEKYLQLKNEGHFRT